MNPVVFDKVQIKVTFVFCNACCEEEEELEVQNAQTRACTEEHHDSKKSSAEETTDGKESPQDGGSRFEDVYEASCDGTASTIQQRETKVAGFHRWLHTFAAEQIDSNCRSVSRVGS